MWAVEWYASCCMMCGLFYGMWAAGYKGCSICGLLNGMWAVCRVCGLLYGMWAVEWYVGCFMVFGLLDIRAAVYVGC